MARKNKRNQNRRFNPLKRNLIFVMFIALIGCNANQYPELKDLSNSKYKLKAEHEKPKENTDLEDLIKQKEEMKNAEI